MRGRLSLSLFSLLVIVACRSEQSQPTVEIDDGPEPSPELPAAPPAMTVKAKLGAYGSSECRNAMAGFAKLDALTGSDASFDAADIRAAWIGPLEAWVGATDSALGRDDAKLIADSLTRLDDLGEAPARRRELVLLTTQIRTSALLEARRVLTAVTDADPSTITPLERATQWDDAWCMWDAAVRPLARRADALPKRGGEDWEATIVDAFTDGRAAAAAPEQDLITPKASRQIIEKGSYAVAVRLILANAESPEPPATSEAAALLDMLDDRVADRNGPGLKRMRVMLNGDPAAVDPTLIERELAVAFSKRARKYCDKAVSKAELGTPGAIAETWEGVVYTKVILPSMREALSAEGFDADAYAADWTSYLEAVESGDADTAAEISARLVEWNCAYQDRLGIAECTSTTNETE